MNLNEYRSKMKMIVLQRKIHGIHSRNDESTLAQAAAQEMINFRTGKANG